MPERNFAMYTRYWSLPESPFQNVADTRYALLPDQHREGMARLLFLADGRKLGGLLVGDQGVGKTMILELIAEHVREQGTSDYLQVDATPTGAIGLARHILHGLGIRETITDLAMAMTLLQNTLTARDREHHHLVLAIDEVQLLREKIDLDFLHLLINLRGPATARPVRNAMTLILSGHPAFLDALMPHRSLSQRLQLVWKLQPLNETQTIAYIQHRIKTAGGPDALFEKAAMTEVYRLSGGFPREINNLCDIALLIGCALEATRIGPEIIRQANDEAHATMAPPSFSEGGGV
jgi:general secretion pathway protein A